ncbi:MAG: hypothetical protein QNJ62_12850 [Methyloceanibacter sp.]|nr:hypothetical protein [Methyloceanibacter sp.]
MAELAADGVPAEDLKPLAELETTMGALALGAPERPAAAHGLPEHQRDRRRKAPPSDTLLARAAAIIDLLVKDGQGDEGAAQRVMRHLLLAGVPAPTQGGDSRGWHRLLEYRNTLLQGGGSDEARAEYAAFGRELNGIPAAQRVNDALTERLWDRRRQARRHAS